MEDKIGTQPGGCFGSNGIVAFAGCYLEEKEFLRAVSLCAWIEKLVGI